MNSALNFTVVTTLLERARQRGPVNGLDDLIARYQEREHIAQHLQWLTEEVSKVRRQVHELPSLPPLSIVRWAQAVQAMPNLVFLEVDTTGLSSDAEIIHVLVLDQAGTTLLSAYARPSRPLSDLVARITGLRQEDLEYASGSLTSLMAQVRHTLRGKYVLAYNLEFDQGKLREATLREGLEEIPIIGEDLMAQAMHYFGLTSYPKLEALCKRIGSPLPEYPHQKAIDRAQGQRSLLDAIANVVTTSETPSASLPLSEVSPDIELDEDDERPF